MPTRTQLLILAVASMGLLQNGCGDYDVLKSPDPVTIEIVITDLMVNNMGLVARYGDRPKELKAVFHAIALDWVAADHAPRQESGQTHAYHLRRMAATSRSITELIGDEGFGFYQRSNRLYKFVAREIEDKLKPAKVNRAKLEDSLFHALSAAETKTNTSLPPERRWLASCERVKLSLENFDAELSQLSELREIPGASEMAHSLIAEQLSAAINQAQLVDSLLNEMRVVYQGSKDFDPAALPPISSAGTAPLPSRPPVDPEIAITDLILNHLPVVERHAKTPAKLKGVFRAIALNEIEFDRGLTQDTDEMILFQLERTRNTQKAITELIGADGFAHYEANRALAKLIAQRIEKQATLTKTDHEKLEKKMFEAVRLGKRKAIRSRPPDQQWLASAHTIKLCLESTENEATRMTAGDEFPGTPEVIHGLISELFRIVNGNYQLVDSLVEEMRAVFQENAKTGPDKK